MKKKVNENAILKRKLVKEAASLELALESSWVAEREKEKYKGRLHAIYDKLLNLKVSR